MAADDDASVEVEEHVLADGFDALDHSPVEDMPEARAGATELAGRASHALIVTAGSSSILSDQHGQRHRRAEGPEDREVGGQQGRGAARDGQAGHRERRDGRRECGESAREGTLTSASAASDASTAAKLRLRTVSPRLP